MSQNSFFKALLRSFSAISATSAVSLLLFIPHIVHAADRREWTAYTNMNYVTSFAEGDREVYVGTTGGVRRFDLFTGREGRPLTTADGLRDNRVRRLAYDRRTGDLYIDTAGGVDRWGTGSEMFFTSARFPEDVPDPSEAIRGAFNLNTLFLKPGLFLQGDEIRDRRFRTYRITGYLFDRWNHLWVGTWGLGVGLADVRDRMLDLKARGPAENNVTAFVTDGDDLWVGGLEGSRSSFEVRRRGLFNAVVGGARGITRHNRRDNAWTTYEAGEVFGLDGADVLAILSDGSDIWFATFDGLIRYQKRSGDWRTYRSFRGIRGAQVTDAVRDGKWLWIGTPAGLALMDVAGDSTLSIAGGKDAYIYDLEKGAGFLWAGTSRGVFRCPVGTASWKRFLDADGDLSGDVTAVAAHGDEVWFAVLSPPGLVRLNAGEDCTTRHPLPELGSRPIAGLSADAGHVWVATEIGAMRLDRETGAWRRYTRADGLVDDRVQAVLREQDGVWFGTTEGISHLKGDGD
jgi:ligand-binding sensor domain-containing protein